MKKLLIALVALLALFWPVIVKTSTDKWPAPNASLDLAGGGRLVYRMSPTGIIAKGWTNTSSKLQALDHAKDTFLFRLREFNLSELVVRTSSDDTIVVEVPDVTQVQAVIEAIGRAQRINFRIAPKDGPLRPPEMDLEDFNYWATRSERDQQDPNKFMILLTARSNQTLADFTQKHLGETLAICLDDLVADKAVIREVITDGNPVISGYPDRIQVENIVKMLKAGPLPVSFDLVEQKIISPTLAARTIHRAVVILGVGMAVIFTLLLLAYSDFPELAVVIGICQLVQASAHYFLAWNGYLTINLLSICALAVLGGVSVDNLMLYLEEFRRVLRENQACA